MDHWLSVAKRHGLIEALGFSMGASFNRRYPWQNATASLKHGLHALADGLDGGYPWQNATASLKHIQLRHGHITHRGYPWQNATASLKLWSRSIVMRFCLALSVAKRHGLIEAMRKLTKLSVLSFVIRGKTLRPH